MNPKNDIELPLISKKRVSVSRDLENAYPHDTQQSKKPKYKSYFEEYFASSQYARKYTPRASFFRWLTFTDSFPFTKQMNRMDKFEMSDVPAPEKCFEVETKLTELDNNWNAELQEKCPQFMRALRRTFQQEIIQALLLTFFDNTIKVYYSIYVGDIVSIITATTVGGVDRTQDLIDSASILSVLVILWLFVKNWGVYVINLTTGRARLVMTGLLYKKLNSTSLTSLHEIKLGKVINLIGNDLNDLQALNMLPAMMVNPLLIIQGTYMMWGYFGPSCLIGLACMVLVVFAQIYFSNKTEVPRRENKMTTDERVKFTHEVIEGIRLIKMYTWDKVFKKKIEDLRQKEQETFTRMIHIDAIGRNFSSLSVYINILVVSIAYVLVGDGLLTPEKVYASMLILMYLSTSLESSHRGRMGLVNFRMIISRIEEVLRVRDIVQVEETLKASAPRKGSSQIQPVEFKNFNGYWSHTAQKPCLSNINLTFNPGTLTAVIGRIGSGKSSLLFSLLKELPLTTGVLNCTGKIAYVEQDPIIFSGTFRDNVLFGREYDEAECKQVLSDCNLDRDLQSFKFGDLTNIGERGVNLSGGQKARISLARALYSQSDVYLLDDPFSALDSKVSRDIFNRVLKRNLAKNKIVILVTHHLHFAKESDHVIMMDEGRVEAQGSFAELERLDLSLLNVFKIEAQKRLSDDMTRKESVKQEAPKAEAQVIAKTQEKGTKEEAAQVTLKTYKDYFQVKGDRRIFLELSLLFLVPHILIVYYSSFIGYWAEQQTKFYYEHQGSDDAQFDHSYYITLSIIMLVILTVVSHIKIIKLNMFLISTNTELHQRMLNSLVRAKVLFFDLNPIGRILNRFANDLGILDKGNMRMIFETIENCVSHFALLITVCLINPAILLPMLFVVYGLYQARVFFNKPMMLTKKLELAAKSPMISYVPATLQGLIIIRVYNQGGRFIREFLDLIYNSTKTFAFLTKTTRLFMLSLEAPVQLLTVSGVWIFVVGMLYYDFGPGLIGLSLMYLMKIGSTCSFMIRQSLEVDVNMQSAQRMLDYCNLQSEAADFVPEKDAQVEEEFNGRWPNKGEIVFNNVFLKYREDLDFALKGLSLDIPGGLKIACIGRTGAGKSSIIQALFRMVEIEKGPDYQDSFIKIDGVDIHKIGLNLLRSRLSIIPQSPVIFTGTIKRNLDPFGSLDADKIWRILEEVGLKDHVLALPNKLETDMTVSSSVFSTGQKQLVCLARAIINKSKVVILDEATANVDVETDNFIQKTIMEKFKDCTVLTIAHRLITIANYDKVVVINNGCVAEYDTPYSLLVKRVGDTRITKQNGVFADMVNSTGQGMAKKIFDIARDHFLATNQVEEIY